jgi:hypothetical protein
VVFTPHLQHIASKVSLGEIVILRNYIAQPVSRNDVALICLDVSVTGTSHPIIGDPLDYKVINACNVQREDVSVEGQAFVSALAEDFCKECCGNPCSWSQYGTTIVDAIQVSMGLSLTNVDSSYVNKSRRFAAYQKMYTRIKHGHPGRGNHTPLPKCVSDYMC